MNEIRHMKLHQSGYVVPWAIQMVFGKPTLCLNYDIGVAPAGTRTVRLTLTEAGYVAEGWTPAEEQPSNAALSIVTRQYPWTGATDDDVAAVIVKHDEDKMIDEPKRHYTASGTVTRRGHNILIAAPGVGVKITIIGATFQLEDRSVLLRLINGKGGATVWKAVMSGKGDGIAMTFPIDTRPRLSDNAALILNLSRVTSCGYTIWYYLS